MTVSNIAIELAMKIDGISQEILFLKSKKPNNYFFSLEDETFLKASLYKAANYSQFSERDLAVTLKRAMLFGRKYPQLLRSTRK